MTWTTQPRSDAGPLRAIKRGQAGDEARPVVLIHGVGLRAEAWGAQIDDLSHSYRVTAVDMPGHGHSAALPDAAGLGDFTDAVAAGMSEPALLVGHSMGAMIALDLAARYPAFVAGVAALNAIFERTPQAALAVQARAADLNGQDSADPAPTLTRWFGADDTAERAACAAWLTQVDPAAYKTAYTIFAHSNGPPRAALAQLPCPALFMTGGDEPNSTPAMSRAMAALAPRGRAQIVPGAAHMMPMTHATDVTTALKRLAQEVWP